MTAHPVIGVIGCGNIGSRHLQALALFDSPASVIVIDPNEESRTVSASRVDQVDGNSDVTFSFHDNMDALPATIDIAVVATGAGPRRAILDDLLDGRTVKNLLLEKFLFQTHRDYDHIGTILKDRNIATTVNTPRRMWPVWSEIKALFTDAGPLTVTVETGKASGMASNAIHYFDLAAFLTGEGASFDLDGSGLTVLEGISRHDGAIEFEGVLTGTSARGDLFIHRARPHADMPHLIVIQSASARAIVDEPGQRAIIMTAGENWTLREMPVPATYQSALTHIAVRQMLDGATCLLPSFEESARLHRQCLSAFLQAMGKERDCPDCLCPVT